MVNYLEPDGPYFSGDYRQSQALPENEIKVVTWNIRYSKQIENAIQELKNIEELQEVDLLLLQEVDEKSVDEIAKSLSMMYVYYPASIHNYHDKNFGNAILSKFFIEEHEKIILPFSNPKNGQVRIAVKSKILLGDEELSVICVHTETNLLGKMKRLLQYDELINSFEDKSGMIVIGGDFNTLTNSSITKLNKRFAKNGFSFDNEEFLPTVEFMGYGFKMDHIFSQKIQVIDTGVWKETQASDHYPLWVIFDLTQ
jgi:endonuclease/exonuclease/phosphatase family metal-dependent hydrolase